MSDPMPTQEIRAGELAPAVAARLRAWKASELLPRLWRKDPTIWSPDPLPELADRLGWLDLPKAMRSEVDSLESFARQVAGDGIRDVVLLGMGGSSLAPEVFERCLGAAADRPGLAVLDSTHPDAVRQVEQGIRLDRSLFLVASKSGSTIETLSFFRYFWARLGAAVDSPGRHFVAITDPGSSLEALARQRGFRRVFLAPEDVGGRYSALTPFGLVPAALLGVDLEALLDGAAAMASACGPRADVADSPGPVLGALLAEAALAGRDKLTLITSPELASFPDWVEQLVAESTGKDGRGIVPIVRESPAAEAVLGSDRLFVAVLLEGSAANRDLEDRLARLSAAGHPVAVIRLGRPIDLGAEMFRWELATATAGAALGIQPFDQPDVQLAKRLAQKAMAGGAGAGGDSLPTLGSRSPGVLAERLGAWLAGRLPGDYIAVQAYLPAATERVERLEELVRVLRDSTGLATTLGFGPRFLHSTGQLHKGGGDGGFFLQLVDAPDTALEIPETDFGFRRLIAAQAAGDAAALIERRRRFLRIDLDGDSASGIEALIAAVRSVPGAG